MLTKAQICEDIERDITQKIQADIMAGQIRHDYKVILRHYVDIIMKCLDKRCSGSTVEYIETGVK